MIGKSQEQRIEDAARAFYATNAAREIYTMDASTDRWANASEPLRERYRARAKAALEAADAPVKRWPSDELLESMGCGRGAYAAGVLRGDPLIVALKEWHERWSVTPPLDFKARALYDACKEAGL